MDLGAKAPLLGAIWPYALALGTGMAMAKVLGYVGNLKQDFINPGRGRGKRVRFAVAGKLEDEDDYVFMDRDQDKQEEEEEDGNDSSDHASDKPPVPYSMPRMAENTMLAKSQEFYELMNTRRTVRFFSSDPVPSEVIENIIRTAGTSPSGAHMEPWTYAVVANAQVKSQIRVIIEKEEEINYKRRMGDKWVSDLSRFKTDWNKPYLEEAPYILVVFKQSYSLTPSGEKKNHYYSEMSTCISVGLILAALTNVGLTTVTSTPMNAGPRLRSLLNRPANEKVLLLLPIGYPAKDATVPDLQRKSLDEIMIHI